jgi:hypothetical protein
MVLMPFNINNLVYEKIISALCCPLNYYVLLKKKKKAIAITGIDSTVSPGEMTFKYVKW